MNILFYILLLFGAKTHPLVSVTYYVDPNGSDAEAGTSTGTAWATVAKVNGSSFNPTDIILFKRGGVWNESLVVPSSGTSGNEITFGAYGTGANPIITGFTTVTSPTHAGNIWSKNIGTGLSLNTVMVDGAIRQKARYPNSTYLHLITGTTTVLTTDLTGTPDYTGAEIVVRSSHFTTDVSIVTSQSGGTINMSPALTYPPIFGTDGYFFQNYDAALDVDGEWTYNSTTGVLKVYSASTPVIKYSNQEYTVSAFQKNYITIDGIDFEGANYAAIKMDSCNFSTVKNCNISNNGQYGVFFLGSHNAIIRSNSIINSLNDAVYLASGNVLVRGSDSAHIDSNYIFNTGVFQGMATANFTKNIGIYTTGIDNVVSNNRIDSTGFNAVHYYGKRTMIKNNYINTFCFVKDDGGGIYSGIGGFYPIDYNDYSVERGNIIFGGSAALDGAVPTLQPQAVCIYLDDYARLVTVDSNLLVDGIGNTILFNQADSLTVHNNNILSRKNGTGIGFFGQDGVTMLQDFKYNVVVQGTRSYPGFYRLGGFNFTGIDSNFYSKSVDSLTTFTRGTEQYSLSGWQVATGMDLNSISIFPSIISSLPKPVFNASAVTVTQTLDGSYYDAFGNTYINEITLLPYQNKLLFKNYTDYINGGRIR